MALELACPFKTADAFQWSIRGAAQSGPASLIGRPTIASLDGGGWWEATLSSIPAVTADTIGYLQTVQSLADSGAAEFVVPCSAKKTAPWPLDANGNPIIAYDQIPFDDESLFDDGSGFYQSVIDYKVAAAAELRATTLVLTQNYGSDLRAIEFFSIDHLRAGRRLYRITSAAKSGSDFTCSIRPPLREAVAAGTEVDFDTPSCTMQMSGTNGLDLDVSRLGRANLSSAKFVEAP